jgi:hypothetical protein
MKITAIIVCLSFCSIAMAQKDAEFKKLVLGNDNYTFTTANSDFYYEKAKSLMTINNPDSLLKASKIMWGLNMFDTARYSYQSFVPWLDKIVKSNTLYYSIQLQGAWRFSHIFFDGMGYANDPTPEDTCQVVKFDGHNASFYFKDSLYRKTTYSIESRQAGFYFQRVNIYNICFYDSEERWWLTLKPGSMSVKLNFLCSCGCDIYIYKKLEK